MSDPARDEKDGRLHPREARGGDVRVYAGRWPGRPLRGKILDYSEGGLRVRLDEEAALEPGSPITLEWKLSGVVLHGSTDPLRMRGHVRRRDPSAPGVYGVSFRRSIQEHSRRLSVRLGLVASAAFTLLIAALIAYTKADHLRWFWHAPFLKFYSLMASAFILSRFLFSAFYREPADRGHLPKVSLVITVKDEVGVIEHTVECCLASRYPSDLLEVIVVDDGSTDGTAEKLDALVERNPSLKLIRFPENKGKRHAMAAGAEAASGEDVVYVDSDSFVEPDAVYKLVQPFADKSVGAVAGHVLVDIEPGNFISKMESVRYYISHRILKASESVFGAVTCCSGAFSAYRREALLEVLKPWLGQRFLGVPATFGDDRSLTNHILRSYKVLLHNGARCATRVPDTWAKYFSQQLRWKKSWMRETAIASGILYREHPLAAVSYYSGVLITLLSPIVLLYSVVYLPIVAALSPIYYLTGIFLSYLFLCLLSFFYTRSRYWVYGIPFAGLYIGVLCWQNYYAMATVHRNSWGTR